jgi:hypothetical protein
MVDLRNKTWISNMDKQDTQDRKAGVRKSALGGKQKGGVGSIDA